MPSLTIIYPSWPKISEQTEFHLPPHGPVCLAATIPPDFDVTFIDENVSFLDFGLDTDLVCLSMMLTCQIPRGHEIADNFRKRGIPVIAGGIAAMLHAEEVGGFVDSIFLGEAEDGRFENVLKDWQEGKLQEKYDYLRNLPPIESVSTARRNILDYDLYKY